MKRIYILMVLAVISLSGCNSYRNRSASAKIESASNEQSGTLSVKRGEICNDSLEVDSKAETNVQHENEQIGLAASKMYEFLFYLSAFINVCLIIIVYKKGNYISELREDIENNKWRGHRENDSKKWERNDSYARPSPPKIKTESSSTNNRIEQETKTEEKIERPVALELSLENTYKYLMPAYQGRFTKLFEEPSGKTRFRCWQKDNVWHFEFHGNLKTAIENYNSTFDETCIVEGSYQGATQYETLSPGTFDNDKNLKILTKSVIRLY